MKFICLSCGTQATLVWGKGSGVTKDIRRVSNLQGGYMMLCRHCGLAQVLEPVHRMATPEDIRAMPALWREQMLNRQSEILEERRNEDRVAKRKGDYISGKTTRLTVIT